MTAAIASVVPRWIAVVDEQRVYEVPVGAADEADEAVACSAAAEHIGAMRAAWKGANRYEADDAYGVLLVDTHSGRVSTWQVDVEGSENTGYRVEGWETDGAPTPRELELLGEHAAAPADPVTAVATEKPRGDA